MPQVTPKFDVIPLQQAISKYFELSIYLLVLMGFGTLASTGGIDLATIVLVGAALAFRKARGLVLVGVDAAKLFSILIVYGDEKMVMLAAAVFLKIGLGAGLLRLYFH